MLEKTETEEIISHQWTGCISGHWHWTLAADWRKTGKSDYDFGGHSFYLIHNYIPRRLFTVPEKSQLLQEYRLTKQTNDSSTAKKKFCHWFRHQGGVNLSPWSGALVEGRKHQNQKDLRPQVKKIFPVPSNSLPCPLPPGNFFVLWRRKLENIARDTGNSRDFEANQTHLGVIAWSVFFRPNCTDEWKESSRPEDEKGRGPGIVPGNEE